MNAMGMTGCDRRRVRRCRVLATQQLGGLETGTIQDSWDHNSGARNANLEMMNGVILLGTALADLTNSRNAMTTSDLSGSSQSGIEEQEMTDRPGDTTASATRNEGSIWDAEKRACIEKREAASNVQLMLQPE